MVHCVRTHVTPVCIRGSQDIPMDLVFEHSPRRVFSCNVHTANCMTTTNVSKNYFLGFTIP